jgi:NAD+ kinase
VAHVALHTDPRALDTSAVAPAPDLAVVLGGDGSILAAARAFARTPVPTLGINFGRIGFLASVPASHWREALDEVLSGQGLVEPRTRLAASRGSGPTKAVPLIALNEVMLHRAAVLGMVTVALFVDGEWVTDYRADGLIVATPSGSTGHSLSAGGPILLPAARSIAVTPVCPQGLAYRPIVLSEQSRLEVLVRQASGPCSLVLDGQAVQALEQGERVAIAVHPETYPLLSWSKLDAYRRLRERLGWSGVTQPLEDA